MAVGIVLVADRGRRFLARASIPRRIERTLGLVLVGLGCEFALETANR
jgi:threonine/homoserine/homoserine lactone efflux protein